MKVLTLFINISHSHLLQIHFVVIAVILIEKTWTHGPYSPSNFQYVSASTRQHQHAEGQRVMSPRIYSTYECFTTIAMFRRGGQPPNCLNAVFVRATSAFRQRTKLSWLGRSQGPISSQRVSLPINWTHCWPMTAIADMDVDYQRILHQSITVLARLLT